MEPLQPVLARPSSKGRMSRGRRILCTASLALPLLGGLPGCIPTSFLADSAITKTTEVSQIPCNLTVRWEHEIHYPANTENKGLPTPQIVGRVYLFPSDLTTPVRADGTMLVYLWNDMPEAKENKDPLDIWVFATADVKKLERRDAAGWSYTLLLPWANYKPELTHVRIMVRFDRIGSKDVLYSDTIPVTFENEASPVKNIPHRLTGPVVPKNGQLFVPAPAGSAPNMAGQPSASSNGQFLAPSTGVGMNNLGTPDTTITKSPAPANDNVPFIVPGAGSR